MLSWRSPNNRASLTGGLMSSSAGPKGPLYFYSSQFQKFNYGPTHPLRMIRLELTNKLIELVHLPGPVEDFQPASYQQLGLFHDRHYLTILKELSQGEEVSDYFNFGLGAGDNPVFPGIYDLSSLATGGSIAAAKAVVEGGRETAFAIAGGMHHALAGRASGFCYINDPVVAIKTLVQKGLRIAYVDIDAHHGDGVQWAFFDTDQVLTISLHQHGATLFPGTGGLEEVGRNKGKGFSLNLPFWPDTDDDIFMDGFDRVVPPALEAFAPDYVVVQLGVDTLLADPLANMNLSTKGFCHAVRYFKEQWPGRWIALGGGGYNVINVARCWTLAWAIMLGKYHEVPDMLPEKLADLLKIPADERFLKDPEQKIRGRFWDRAKRDAEDAIKILESTLFPALGAKVVKKITL